MLRAIIVNKHLDPLNGAATERHYTIDFDAQELEAAIDRGGFSEDGYDFHVVLGIEVRSDGQLQTSESAD